MATDSQTVRKARSDYIYKRRNLVQIATALGVSSASVGRWKKKAKAEGDDWDTSRAAYAIAGEGLDAVITHVVDEFMIMAQHMIEELKGHQDKPEAERLPLEQRVGMITSLADAMNKMTNSAGKLAPKISELGVAQDVIGRLSNYVREHQSGQAKILLEVLEPFAETLAEAYS